MNTAFSSPSRATFLNYVLLTYSFASLFIIPYGTIPYAKLFIPIVIIVFVLEIIYEKITFNLADIFLSIGIILTNIIPEFTFNRFADAITIIILLFKYKGLISINRTFVTIIYYLGLLSTIYHIIFTRYSVDNNTILLNNPDPNFSGLLALLLFLFCYKNKFILGIIACLSCVVLLWSRNYLLALLVFFGFSLLEKFAPFIFQRFYRKVGIIKIIALFLCLNLGLLFYSIAYVERIKSPISLGLLRNDPNRFVALEDDSNWYRFNANKEFFELVQKNSKIMWFGISSIKPEKEDTNPKDFFPTKVPPHNSLFDFIFVRGILFTTFYLFAFALILKRLYFPQNLKYLLPILIFGLFLHAVYSSALIIFMITIISMPERDEFLRLRNSASNIV